MQVIPAVLEENSSSLLSQIQRLSPYFYHFQIDIQDGNFVSSRTVQIEEIITTMTHLNNGAMENLTLDFHLMTQDYQSDIEKLEKLRGFVTIRNVFLHLSLHPNILDLTSDFSNLTFGLVLNPEDSVYELTKTYNLQTIPFIQIMSIHPGPQGTEFIPETLKKIDQLRLNNYRSKVYLDGGINESTIPIIKLQKNQPDYLCIGSFLTKSKDLKKTLLDLKKVLDN